MFLEVGCILVTFFKNLAFDEFKERFMNVFWWQLSCSFLKLISEITFDCCLTLKSKHISCPPSFRRSQNTKKMRQKICSLTFCFQTCFNLKFRMMNCFKQLVFFHSRMSWEKIFISSRKKDWRAQIICCLGKNEKKNGTWGCIISNFFLALQKSRILMNSPSIGSHVLEKWHLPFFQNCHHHLNKFTQTTHFPWLCIEKKYTHIGI